LDAQELFYELAPHLKEHTHKFVKDFWATLPEAAWREKARGPTIAEATKIVEEMVGLAFLLMPAGLTCLPSSEG
jgi:hypothetical protein